MWYLNHKNGECRRAELLNCGAWEDSWESLIQQDQTSQSERKSTSNPCCLSWGIYWGPPGGKNSTSRVPHYGSSKQIVCSPTHGETQKAWRLCAPWVSQYMRCILPSSMEAKEGAFWALQEGDGSGIHWGHHLTIGLERTEQVYVAVICWLGVGQKETSSPWSTSPNIPWRRRPMISAYETGWRESISLSLIIPLNEEVAELVGHHKLFHGLDHRPGIIFRAASPQLQSCSSGGNWQSCVLLGQGHKTM